MIDLINVTKLYKAVIGVNDINLSLEPGIYGLLGPNGSGKTTLVNLILGQIRPTLGQVRLFGQNPWQNSTLLSHVGLCPALEMNLPNVSALQWVTHLVRLHGYTVLESERRALQALEFVQLSHAMRRPMTDYSLGMRQRAKLAQAIAHDPKLLILDEPFNGLDPVARFEMIQFLKQWGEQGKSLILSSHILHEVEAIQPSFLLISGGRLLASGTPDEVRLLLANSPGKMQLHCNNARKLASTLMQRDDVQSIEISADESVVDVSSKTPATLLEQLPRLTQELEITIYELHSANEPLKELFATLMRFHRGENRPEVNRNLARIDNSQSTKDLVR
ncbi:MAG: ABC transporter ATP-binding protein [Pirellulaceae bacterium]